MTEFDDFLEIVNIASEKFEELHGALDHTAITIAPANLMLLGDHTHYNDGILLSTRVNKYWVCVLRKRKDKTISFASGGSGKFVSSCIDNNEIDNNNEFRLLFNLTKLLCKNEIIDSGFDCVIEGNIPDCFGLGKISSLQVAFINGIKKIFSIDKSEEDLLKFIHENEIPFVGKISNVGHHYGIQFGKENKILSFDLRGKKIQHLNFFPKNYEIIVCDTDSVIENSNTRCNERVVECEVGVKSLRLYIWGIKNLRDINSDFLLRHYHMVPKKIFNRVLYNVTERKRAQDAINYISSNAWEDFGTLIKASHWALSQDYEVADSKVDFLVESASIYKGVIASKMISCSTISATFNIVQTEKADDFCNSISNLYKEKFNADLKTYRLKTTGGVKKFSSKKILINPN